ncbi:Cellulase (glycosyl hydrolase family 5) [Aquisphaera giovannonii]|uniref:mannan endo-1,4-beta-mannosidase n=1 Tax=Aquisphaera giovannonii TaxID=406548 RepID=A0A5B9W9K0_9BACT|nr:cellulase family glycosylhydrolase [Aquisphaera giovannonii]QEH37206.1 Cellulase (glycosyl hydrolase family 5) [Aquisphaera giovannonii]
MKRGILAVLAVAACLPARAAAPTKGFVAADGPRLVIDGREFRAVGVNVPHLHQIYLGTWFHLDQFYGTREKAKAAAVEAVEDASRSGMAFIRFFAGPGYPIEAHRLYGRDPAAYWRGMDELFALCRSKGVRLIPCLNVASFHADAGEPRGAVLDASSRTHRACRSYVRAFVSRYKDDPTVLLWELENELMLAADVDMRGDALLPRGVYPEGATVREVGTREDSLTWEMTQRLYRDQAAFIRSIDPNHLVTSGDAGVRPEATSRRETFPDFRYRDDSWREHLANELAAQPEPLGVYSLHHYGPADPGPKGCGLDALERARHTARAIRAAGVPLLIGELGQDKPTFRSDPEARWARAYLDMAEAEGISLIALWVWHFPWQPELTLDGRSHPTLIRRAREFNSRHAASGR